jgi:hypothetical protein
MNFQNRYDLPDELVSVVERELAPGESVNWTGQPIPGRLSRAALPTVLFGIPWTAFAIFWTALAASGTRKSGGFTWLFSLWGVPFILIGIGMLTAPFWIFRKAKRTAYLLTNTRAIIVSIGRLKRISVRSFDLEAMKDLQRNENADGSGDLIFAEDISSGSKGSTNITRIGFLAIKEVKNVEEQVRQLVRNRATNPI